MTKNPRRRVVAWEERLLPPPYDSWGPTMHAVLECGHVENVGHSSLRPKRKACRECGLVKQSLDHWKMRAEASEEAVVAARTALDLFSKEAVS